MNTLLPPHIKNGLAAWQIDARDFPARGTAADKLKFLVNYAVLAPSKYNAQPWLFELCGDSLDLICDRSWAFRITDPLGRELMVSCGAALLNLRLAARHFGYEALIQTFPWPGDRYLLARIRLGLAPVDYTTEDFFFSGAAGCADEDLFAAMQKRRTHLGRFWNGAPPREVLEGCRALAIQQGASLRFVVDPGKKRELAALVCAADRRLMAEPSFRRESARWIHCQGGRSRDGVTGAYYGLAGPMNLFTPGLPLLLGLCNLGPLIGLHHRELTAQAPVLGVISTDEDEPQSWLDAGQALQLVLLRTTVSGLATSFLNQPIEAEDLRMKVRSIVGDMGYPQILFRLGYGASGRRTPRRAASEVLL